MSDDSILICHPKASLVESTNLTQRKTDHWNGITLKTALVVGRYGKEVPTDALESRIA
jgi:hypothetical protein